MEIFQEFCVEGFFAFEMCCGSEIEQRGKLTVMGGIRHFRITKINASSDSLYSHLR